MLSRSTVRLGWTVEPGGLVEDSKFVQVHVVDVSRRYSLAVPG